MRRDKRGTELGRCRGVESALGPDQEVGGIGEEPEFQKVEPLSKVGEEGLTEVEKKGVGGGGR